MPLKYSQNKKHVYKWIENNKDRYRELNRLCKLRNYDDDKREKKRLYYQAKKQIGLLKEFPFFHCDVIEL